MSKYPTATNPLGSPPHQPSKRAYSNIKFNAGRVAEAIEAAFGAHPLRRVSRRRLSPRTFVRPRPNSRVTNRHLAGIPAAVVDRIYERDSFTNQVQRLQGRCRARSLDIAKPRYCVRRHVKQAREFAGRFSCVAAFDRFLFLVRRKFRRASHVNTARLRALAAFAGASAVNSRSNSARPPNTVSISRPCGVVVSALRRQANERPRPCRRCARGCSRGRVSSARDNQGA